MRQTTAGYWAISALLGATAGCGGNNFAQSSNSAPRVVSATTKANPNSVLSALIVFRAEGADSARVVYLTDGAPLDSTPYVKVSTHTQTIATVGLRPSTTYHNVLEIAGPLGVARSDTLTFTTSALPELVQRVSITTSGTAGSGLTLTSVQVGGNTIVALAFDSSGAIRWYRQFPGT